MGKGTRQETKTAGVPARIVLGEGFVSVTGTLVPVEGGMTQWVQPLLEEPLLEFDSGGVCKVLGRLVWERVC